MQLDIQQSNMGLCIYKLFSFSKILYSANYA